MFRICAKQDIVLCFLGAECNCGFRSHALNEVEFKLMDRLSAAVDTCLLGITRPAYYRMSRVCMHTCLQGWAPAISTVNLKFSPLRTHSILIQIPGGRRPEITDIKNGPDKRLVVHSWMRAKRLDQARDLFICCSIRHAITELLTSTVAISWRLPT